MVKKNQVIITALAIMIAVAGYLNFTGTQMKEESLVKDAGNITEVADSSDVTDGTDTADFAASDHLKDENIDVSDISDEDMYSAGYTEIESLDSDSDMASSEQSEPGEAVLTGSTAVGIGVVANAKLMKEQTRAKNKETLLEVINNDTVGDSQKQDAINEMIAMTDITERETAAEILLAAKGFTDAIVSITGNSADVVINSPTLTEAERAQIEDIVKRKTGVNAENLVITPISE